MHGDEQKRISFHILKVCPLRFKKVRNYIAIGDATPRPIVPIRKSVNDLEHLVARHFCSGGVN
jgi:hypothetical protein